MYPTMATGYQPQVDVVATPVVAQGVAVATPVAGPSGVLPPAPASSSKAQANEAHLLEVMAAKGYPHGLTKELLASRQHFPLRFWVVDNSGSMQSADGSRVVTDAHGNRRMIGCTRWAELVETVGLAAEVAVALDARTDFALLNPAAGVPHVLTVGADPLGLPVPPGHCVDLAGIKEAMMRVSPAGTTPLTEAVMRVCSLVAPIEGELRARALGGRGLSNRAGHPIWRARPPI